MTDDAYYHRGPVTVCMPVGHFFKQVVTEVIGAIEPPFRVLGVTYDYERDEATVDYENPPADARMTTMSIRKVGGVAVSRVSPVEAIARTARVYSRRVNRATGVVMPPSAEWASELRHDFPGWFDIEFECNAGWSDMIRAMAEWLREIGVSDADFNFTQVKEKFAGLRAYSVTVDMLHSKSTRVRNIVSAFEAISTGICESCGEPGKVRKTEHGYFYTACDKHADDPPV